jgi:serine/threonine protein kinase
VFVLASAGLSLVLSHMVWSAQQEVRRLGTYRLERLLGTGGMGQVWLATHRLLARRAAIKVVRPEVLGGDRRARRLALARFEQEARITASLRSPHTVALYDFGVSEAGAFYYVMELLSGFDAAELVTRFGPMPAERAVHVLRQMCDSLGEAHARGLVHRDVKPSNVYVCSYRRAADFVKVLDFGLVKPRWPGAPQLTSDNVVSGIHVTRAGAGRARDRRPVGPAFGRVRRLLAAHRREGVRGPDGHGDHAEARAGGARAAVPAHGAGDSLRARGPRDGVPGQGSRASPAGPGTTRRARRQACGGPARPRRRRIRTRCPPSEPPPGR